jgi:hypothetical protein
MGTVGVAPGSYTLQLGAPVGLPAYLDTSQAAPVADPSQVPQMYSSDSQPVPIPASAWAAWNQPACPPTWGTETTGEWGVAYRGQYDNLPCIVSPQQMGMRVGLQGRSLGAIMLGNFNLGLAAAMLGIIAAAVYAVHRFTK